MNFQVKLFARARDAAGTDSLTITLPADATVADLRSALCQTSPALKPLLSGLLIAVNAQYAADAMHLTPDADIACFPPVSGG